MMRDKASRSAIPILGLLTWRPMAGYELKTEIKGSLGNFWSESFGQLYPQLRALSAAGLIEEAVGLGTDKRGKRVYAITETGRAALAAWLIEPPGDRPPRHELLMKVFFASEGDIEAVIKHCRAARYHAAQLLKRYRGIEARLERLKPDRPKARYWLMTLRLGIAQTECTIAWCDETINEIET